MSIFKKILYTARDGSDYTGTTLNLDIPVGSPNSFMKCVDVSITDDTDAVEGDETFTVTLTESADDVTLGNSVTTVTIMDNEGIHAANHIQESYYFSQSLW